MNSFAIRLVVVLGVVSIVGIITMQVYWVRKALAVEERQLDQKLHLALRNVAAELAAFNQASLPAETPVRQLSSNYYVVNVNTAIDAGVLEYYLRREFAELNLHTDYEYGIYDCASDQMVHGRYVAAGSRAASPRRPTAALPKWNHYTYYFGLYLPNRTAYLTGKLDAWLLSSGVLLLVVVFFAYALFVILRQKQLSEIQRDFINNMTHEFKTPIATIGISAEVLAQPDIVSQPQRLRSYAGIIREENRRLNQQVDKVLQMARSERGQVRLHRETVDLHALIEQVIRNFDLPGKHPQARAELALEAAAPYVEADPTHLANVLFNLLDNAAKYAGPAPVVRLATRTAGRRLQLTVADNGLGIAPAHQKRVFDKFYRVPRAKDQPVPGFGLGLYYVRNVAAAHRWPLRLRSQPGQGSTFTLEFPLAPAAVPA